MPIPSGLCGKRSQANIGSGTSKAHNGKEETRGMGGMGGMRNRQGVNKNVSQHTGLK